MPRRRRKEPLWPFLLVVGMLIVGLAIGRLIPDGRDSEAPLAALGEDGAPSDVTLPSPEDRTRVEVLNGSGVAGVAAEATEILRAAGLDVVYFGNEGSFGRDSSVVLDRTGRLGAAETVSVTLGIVGVRVEPDTTRLVDLTVLIGTDWAARIPSATANPADVEIVDADTDRAWWDPRRLFEGGQ